MKPARCKAAQASGLLLLTACSGGGPLLHPAHTLPAGAVSFAAGSSGHFALGNFSRAQDDFERAALERGGAMTQAERERFTLGALTRFAIAPGVTPFVAGRVGLGHTNEAGLSYTARSLRVDGRHAFEWPSLALSVGLVGIGALPRISDGAERSLDSVQESGALRSMKLRSTRGLGLELPVLFGYRSSADVVKLWAGLRAGVERDAFQISTYEASQASYSASGHATRYWAGGLVGFSVGLAPIEVRVELDSAYESVRGLVQTAGGDVAGDIAGLSLTPAMAISANF